MCTIYIVENIFSGMGPCLLMSYSNIHGVGAGFHHKRHVSFFLHLHVMLYALEEILGMLRSPAVHVIR